MESTRQENEGGSEATVMKWELVASQTGAMGEEARRTRYLDVLRARSLGCAGGFDVWRGVGGVGGDRV